MNCRCMEKDSNFSAPRRNGASSAKRFAPTSKAFSGQSSSTHGKSLKESLQKLPDSRPEAVARAKRLIADPNYPPRRAQQILAKHLAVRLMDDLDSLPS